MCVRFFLLVGFVLYSVGMVGQDLGQAIRGKVKNQTTQKPLAGASVSIFKSDVLVAGSVSDSLGNFQILNVNPGRYKLSISFTGFGSFEDELLVISGKESIVNAGLSESSTVLKEVEVRASTIDAPGVTSVSIEKSMRVPANFFDPVRMLTSYPGVVATSDQSNSIVVKGYSPNGLLWRLQGLDIVSPNHLANAGTFSDKPVANGGGVNVLSAQLLDRTDFYSGALPASYGNALSGVMDMKLRAGNKNKMQYTAQASLIGMDVAAEGPIDKNKRTSFVANYRYSTVGFLSQMGVNFGDEVINFQDFSFHLDQQQKKGGNLSVFGFGGLSTNKFNAKPADEWKEEKDHNTINYDGKVFGVGFVNQFKTYDRLSLSLGGSLSGQFQERNSQSEVVPNPNPYVYTDQYSNDKVLFSSFLKALYKLGPDGTLETGIMANHLNNKLVSNTITPLYFDTFYPNVNGRVSGMMLQPYASWVQKFGSWKLNAGLRYVNFSYNKATSLEPRLSIAHYLPKGAITLSYGLTGQWQQMQTYLQLGNQNLKLTKAHQFAVEYKHSFANDLRMVSTAYYHLVYNVPGESFNLNYSTLNQLEDFSRTNLLNNGKGVNYGIEGLVEKKFYSKVYFMVTGSLYRSEYNATGYYTRFNGRFTSSFLAGKEWQKKRNTFGVNTRILYLGGLREAPIDAGLSSSVGSTQYNYQNGYSVQLPDYFRTDLRLSWRKNKPGYTRTFALDIQNLFNTQNIAYHYYDTYLQEVKTKYQLGLIPVLVYRVEF